MANPLRALGATWLAAALVVVLAAAVHTQLLLAIDRDPRFGGVLGPVLTGAGIHFTSFEGPAYPDVVLSVGPNLRLLGGVAALACAAGIAARAAQIHLLTRWAGTAVNRGGPPYRSVQPTNDPVRRSRAAIRAFTIRLSLVVITALSVTLFGAVRGPHLSHWRRDGSSKTEVAARTVAVLVEDVAFTPITLALLATVWPTRRRSRLGDVDSRQDRGTERNARTL